jgi:hypothetical protein
LDEEEIDVLGGHEPHEIVAGLVRCERRGSGAHSMLEEYLPLLVEE